MMRIILDEGLYDSSFVEERCENFAAFKTALKKFSLNYVSRITGVPADKIVAAARLYASTKPATILYTLGITEHSHGTDNVIAVANLAMLTGNVGKPSSGVNPLRGQNNVQGACDMGCLPNVYPGYQAVTNPAIKKKFESAWGCSLSPKAGLTMTEVFDTGRRKPAIKALYISGENPALTDPDASHVQEMLANMDFLVVQDIFLTETARLASVVLPGASFAEKDGTFTNTERRVQRVRKAVEPVGNSKPDWWITCQLGQRMGAKGFAFKQPSQIMDEIARLAPSYGGISFGRLEKGGLQWPCPTRQHPGTPILHTKLFTRGKGRFIPLEYRPPAELPDKNYPLVLSTGRCLYHYHTSMTHKVKGLNVLRGEELVQINPKDAHTLRIADGDRIKVTSRRGQVTARARVTEVTPAGAIWMTFHFAESPTNVLTNPVLDPAVKTPEYKVCAVRVEKAKK
jgi:formate dehydrogenase alpha subunit